MTTTRSAFGFWKTAGLYGVPTGLLIISMMVGSMTIFGFHSGASSKAVGFLIMFVILSLIFFGMKRFRDVDQGSVIKFSKAILLGLSMSLFAGVAYVIIWEIYIAVTGNSFVSHYTDHLIEMQEAKGVSGEALVSFVEKMEEMKTSYAKPSFRIPLTFFEIFPMGFLITLVSALILHTPKFWARKG